MRLAVFVFSLILIFAPIYANALLFVPAITGAVVRTGAGQFIKVHSKKALASFATANGLRTTMHAVTLGYCVKNSKKCKEILGDVYDLFVNSNDDDSTQICFYDGKQFKSPDDLCSYFFEKSNARNNKSYIFADSYKATNSMCLVYGGTNKYNGNAGASFNCRDKKDVFLQETRKITNHIIENDTDYIINNYKNEIDIDIKKYCTASACDELSNEFGNEVNNNKDKYDIDKINKQNCVVQNSKIVSCENAKKEKDEEENQEEQDPKENDATNTKKEDDDKTCDGNELYKKMCEFMKWYQNDDEPEDTKLDIKKQEGELQTQKVDFVGACPPKYELNVTIDFGFLGSKDINLTILDTPKLCGFLNDWVKPIMLFLGPLHAIYILGRNE